MTGDATPNTFEYFAYGSNMCSRRLAARTPSATPVAIGYVAGQRLTFDKVSRDGSGRCDAQRTGTATDCVFGVIFRVASTETRDLDLAEGLWNGYAEHVVSVITLFGAVPALTYLATRKEPALRPYHWYKALVLAGAIEHGLPNDYIEWIHTLESIEHPNAKWKAKNEAVLPAC